MKGEDYLYELKNEYEKTIATRHLRMSGWEEMEKRIGFLEKPRKSIWKNFAVTFALFLLFIGSLFTALNVVVAKSLPGDPLYPVKILAEKIINKASGDNQASIDNRAYEIISLSKKENVDRMQLEQVVSEYSQSVADTKNQIQITGKPNTDFQKHLDEQHSEFDQIEKDNPEIKDQIKKAQDVSEHSGNQGKD